MGPIKMSIAPIPLNSDLSPTLPFEFQKMLLLS